MKPYTTYFRYNYIDSRSLSGLTASTIKCRIPPNMQLHYMTFLASCAPRRSALHCLKWRKSRTNARICHHGTCEASPTSIPPVTDCLILGSPIPRATVSTETCMFSCGVSAGGSGENEEQILAGGESSSGERQYCGGTLHACSRHTGEFWYFYRFL